MSLSSPSTTGGLLSNIYAGSSSDSETSDYTTDDESEYTDDEDDDDESDISELPEDEPAPPPRPVKPSNGKIRVHWAKSDDDTDVTNFREELGPPAMEFPFELDDFQKRAVLRVSHGDSVFVAAHTSAGKTAVAEYAIANAIKQGGRAIYTSPIKALSNQKYREFTEKFDSVGVITGDVSINPLANVVIMTTEILRTMLYRKDESLANIKTVIFDEVHFVNDPDRGVVWEECIILMPPDDKPYLLMDNKGVFNTAAYRKIYDEIRAAEAPAPNAKQAAGKGKGRGKGKGKGKGKGVHRGPAPKQPLTGESKIRLETQKLQGMIKALEADDKLPATVFVFSRVRCERYAMGMPHLDLLSGSAERSKVHVFLKESFSKLDETDRDLPQIQAVTDLALRGIGVHHGGLLPIVKEAVEILFSRGHIKVLFATETFAMGVNMPARSVIFSSIRKHDGSKFRYLLPTEYTQMSGRAGRRGLDSVGNVYVLAAEELPDLKALTTTMTSKHTPLQSQFKLTFQMLLQMAKLTHWKAEDLMSRSYLENARAMQLPTARRDLQRLKKRQGDLPKLECVLGEEDMHRYAKLELKSRHMASDLYGTLFNTDHKKVFCRGRLVMVWSLPDIKASSPAVILGSSPPSMSTSVVATVDVLVVLRKPVPGSSPAGDSGYTVRIKNLPVKSGLLLVTNHALPNGVDFSDAFGLAREMRRCEDAGQFDEPLELGKNLKQIQTEYFDTLIGVKDLTKAKMKSKCHRCHLRQEHFDLVVEEGQIEDDIEDLEFKIDDSSLYLAPARERMLRALVDLGELDKDTMQITLKGRAASELVLGDELTLTELLFRNEFGEADVPSCVALVCCFACDSGVSQMSHEAAEALLPPETVKLLEQAMETHGKVAEILTKERVETDWTEFDKQLCLGIAPLAYAWAKGVPFAELMTAEPIQSKEDEEVYYSLWKPGDKPLQEGAVVRSIQRCDELFRRLGKAAGVMGSTEVVEKVEKCREAIRRDIVFALSLYLEQDGQRQASKAVDEAGEKEGCPVEEVS
ncbi:hypothetical protein FOZ61_010596 [Perkinsus olseni]|uniref:Superkiller viralicidic activity 2-like n=1 Tax=Perkinsus olseni TaxID=32597 RepID=A0A7J6M2J9_PEROL|nr:hypothetical protein FOZ61_010596 [Perkinsus olseni]